ncbi:hypothetical protein QCA50_016911 [Cerrena zonata]|uniref:Uncharacterized protein n=1 Tax=Cerrena zonata TaxID=2478898 RepID=A0AAW0FEH3_9APHY
MPAVGMKHGRSSMDEGLARPRCPNKAGTFDPSQWSNSLQTDARDKVAAEVVDLPQSRGCENARSISAAQDSEANAKEDEPPLKRVRIGSRVTTRSPAITPDETAKSGGSRDHPGENVNDNEQGSYGEDGAGAKRVIPPYAGQKRQGRKMKEVKSKSMIEEEPDEQGESGPSKPSHRTPHVKGRKGKQLEVAVALSRAPAKSLSNIRITVNDSEEKDTNDANTPIDIYKDDDERPIGTCGPHVVTLVKNRVDTQPNCVVGK